MARKKGRLAAAGFQRVPDDERRRYIDPKGKEVSYREAFVRATGRTLEKASARHRGKFARTTDVAKEIRDAAREGRLSSVKLLTAPQEKVLARRSVKSLMRGHTFKSALARGVSGFRDEGKSEVERRSAFGRLLGVLHEGEGDPSKGGPDRAFMRVRAPKMYRRLFGPDSKKARLLVAMGRREAGATYDVGETP